jgi:capsular polysaccharide biosynthesis protein/Mrp family chromosome partitioning ATPase
MEITRFLFFLRKGYWIVLLLVILGAGIGFGISQIRGEKYQATTTVLINRVLQEQISGLTYQNDNQLVEAYIQMITGDLIQSEVSKKLNVKVDPEMIEAAQVGTAQIVKVTVTDHSPLQAATIANTLVAVLIDQNEQIYTNRYQSMEDNLTAKIDQTQAQIDTLQKQSKGIIDQEVQSQMEIMDQQISSVQSQIDALQFDISLMGSTRNVELTDKQAQVEQLRSLLNQYSQIQTNLKVSNGTGGNSTLTNNPDYIKVQSAITLYQQILLTLMNSRQSVQLARTQGIPSLVQIDQANVPQKPIPPLPWFYVSLGAVLGLLISLGSIFIYGYYDNAIRSPVDVRQHLGLNVLGNLPHPQAADDQQDLPAQLQNDPALRDACMLLNMNLERARNEQPWKTIMVTGFSPGRDTDHVAACLAQTAANSGRSVLMIDAGLEGSGWSKLPESKGKLGFSDLVIRRNEPKKTSSNNKLHKGLSVIPFGQQQMDTVLNPARLEEVIQSLSSSYDWVIFNGTPLNTLSMELIAPMMDAVLLTINPGKDRLETAGEMVKQLQWEKVNLIGTVFYHPPRTLPLWMQRKSPPIVKEEESNTLIPQIDPPPGPAEPESVKPG